LVPSVTATVGDLFLPRERAKWIGATAGAAGVATIVGPILGGWLTDHASWRWVFFVNVPIGLFALLALLFVMPKLQRTARSVTVDYVGAVLLILGTALLLLGLSWAGSQYAWLSPQVLGPLGGALLCLIMFVVYEQDVQRRGKEPVLELGLFRSSARVFGVAMLMSFLFGVCIYSATFFIPFFMQGVIGTSVTNSGLLLIPFALTSVIGAITSGMLMSLLGKYKWLAVLGIVLAIAGFLLLLGLDIRSTNTAVLLALLVLGLGLGSGTAIYTTITQNALPDKLGQVSAAVTFFRQIGGAVGLAAMGSVMSAAYLPAFLKAVPQGILPALPAGVLGLFENPSTLLEGPGALAQLQASFATRGQEGVAAFDQLREAMRIGLAQGIHNVFLGCLGIMLVALVAVWFLKELPLRSKKHQQVPGQQVNPPAVSEVDPAQKVG
jgi:EmrB/QacA subfamily drug resistance transporter